MHISVYELQSGAGEDVPDRSQGAMLDSLVSPRSPMTGPFMIYVYLGDSSRSRISFARCAG
jgi:hypothetical protein